MCIGILRLISFYNQELWIHLRKASVLVARNYLPEVLVPEVLVPYMQVEAVAFLSTCLGDAGNLPHVDMTQGSVIQHTLGNERSCQKVIHSSPTPQGLPFSNQWALWHLETHPSGL